MKDREKQRINNRNYYARKKGFKDHAHMLAHKAKQEDHCAPFRAKGWRAPWEIVGWDYTKYQQWLKRLEQCL